MTDLFATTENKGAEFSADKKYRYALWRIWDESKPIAMFIGLNPSIANSDTDDPTIQSVRRISQHNGYGGFFMMNLFGIISTDPAAIKLSDNPIGNNLWWHGQIKERCKDVVFAWGNSNEAIHISKEFIAAYPGALCIGKNKNNSPKHPLYQKGDSKLIAF